jgi:hypothetical protein
VTVTFRGFKNCIRSYVTAEGRRCRPGGRIRTGYDVAAQVERSGTRAIVVVPELAYDAPSILETPRMHDTIVRDNLWKLLAASQM